MRRGAAAALLLLPVVEIALAVAVSQWIGVGPTVVALLVLSAVGLLVIRETGRRGWRDLRDAVQGGVADPQTGPQDPQLAASGSRGGRRHGRGLTMLAGGLLAVPGFLTALAGAVLLLPPVQSVVRRRTRRWADRQGAWVVTDRFGAGTARTPGGRRPGPGDVVQGEVVDED